MNEVTGLFEDKQREEKPKGIQVTIDAKGMLKALLILAVIGGVGYASCSYIYNTIYEDAYKQGQQDAVQPVMEYANKQLQATLLQQCQAQPNKQLVIN